MDASDINRSLVSELKAMGFSEAQATKALCSSGNSSIEAAINWIIDHEKDAYTDEMPMVQRSELDNEDSPSLSKFELRRSCCIKPLNCYPTFLLNKYNEGWENLAVRIEDFINKFSSSQGTFITTGESCKTFTGKGNFKEAISKSKWSHEENAAKDGNHEQTMNGLQEDSALLRRCLVGKVPLCTVKRDAEHMLMGEWRRRPNIESWVVVTNYKGLFQNLSDSTGSGSEFWGFC
ncbi:hypothetical protein BC332_23744 [Capsicum chinense]|nr:hypothetical protein BC332_23744 [Capsicum chinense]